jgi:hypothetical protein
MQSNEVAISFNLNSNFLGDILSSINSISSSSYLSWLQQTAKSSNSTQQVGGTDSDGDNDGSGGAGKSGGVGKSDFLMLRPTEN